MQLIHTQEAKAFLSHEFKTGGSALPLMPVFMAKGSRLISTAHNAAEKRSVATQFMSSVSAAHAKLLHQLRPFLFESGEGLFSGLEPMPAIDPGRSYHPLVMPAVAMLIDYDIFVGLAQLYPERFTDRAAALKDAERQLIRAFSRIHLAEKHLTRRRQMQTQ